MFLFSDENLKIDCGRSKFREDFSLGEKLDNVVMNLHTEKEKKLCSGFSSRRKKRPVAIGYPI